jgi:hypothetical protein
MIITKKAIPRRAVLRGMGATLALPLLDAMVPAFAAMQSTSAKAVPRLGIVYVPNGMMMDAWTPATEGSGFEFMPTMKSLEPFRERLLVLSGLHGVDSEGPHARASTRFLTGVPSKRADGSDLQASVSMDQIAARVQGQHTQLASLELAIDGRDFAGSCDDGFSCAYTNTIAWSGESTPLPMENNPRIVFERMFGDTGSTSAALRRTRLVRDASLLDSVTDRVAELQRGIGPQDRTKIEQYLDAVRDVERRIQKAEEQSARELPVIDQPAGIPSTFGEHARIMYDLMALAYQTDLTRVVTFMLGREITGRTYAEIGVPDAHHPISHHQSDPDKFVKLKKINAYHVSLFAGFLEKLRATADGDGTLLDHVMLIYGAGMADPNAHASKNLPIVLGGGGVVRNGGRHLKYSADTPLANLHLTLLDRMGVQIDRLGHSTGRLPVEPLVGV